jgi:DNA-binding MarR family transcriptional regulator
MKQHVEFYTSLARTLDALQREVEDLLKVHGISEPQYSVLRVLYAAHPEPLSCGDIAAGMVSRDPDITRLLDRLERGGLIERRRGSPDRRLVSVRIQDCGIAMLKRLEEPMRELHRRQFEALDGTEIEVLVGCLQRLRARLEPPNAARLRRESNAFSAVG